MHSNDRALLVAARHGMTDRAEKLLQDGATNIHVRNPIDNNGDNKTPLLLAAAHRHEDMVQLLLQFRADVNDTCPKGMTVRCLA